MTGYVTVSYEGNSPHVALNTLNIIVSEADDLVRNSSIQLSLHRMKYLDHMLQSTTNPDYRSSLLSTYSTEATKVMMGKSDPYYTFDVVDPPILPQVPVWPSIPILMIAAVAFGLILGIGVAFLQLMFPQLRIGLPERWMGASNSLLRKLVTRTG